MSRVDLKLLKCTEIHADHIYKLIHLLCLPEMKIFLDMVRLLAKYTDIVASELWNYIKDGKLVHSAILLFAAQQQLRGGAGKEGINNQNGLDIIIINSLFFESGLSLETRLIELERAVYSEVPHHEVLQHVSSILKDHGFSSPGKDITAGDLSWEHGGTKISAESPSLNIQAKKAMGTKLRDKHDYIMFMPYWRSVLLSRLNFKEKPYYALKAECNPIKPSTRLFHTAAANKANRTNDGRSYPFQNYNIGLLGRAPELRSNHQSRRVYGTAALTLLKMLKRA